MENHWDVEKAGDAAFRCCFPLAPRVVGGKWKPKALSHPAHSKTVRLGALRRAVFGISERRI